MNINVAVWWYTPNNIGVRMYKTGNECHCMEPRIRYFKFLTYAARCLEKKYSNIIFNRKDNNLTTNLNRIHEISNSFEELSNPLKETQYE